MRERWDAAAGAEFIFWALVGGAIFCLVMGNFA